MEQIDQFIGKITKVGNSLMITIPQRNIEFSGLEKGTLLKIWYKKQNE